MPKRNCELGSACPYQARRYTHESWAAIYRQISPSLHLLCYRRCRESATMKRAIRMIVKIIRSIKYMQTGIVSLSTPLSTPLKILNGPSQDPHRHVQHVMEFSHDRQPPKPQLFRGAGQKLGRGGSTGPSAGGGRGQKLGASSPAAGALQLAGISRCVSPDDPVSPLLASSHLYSRWLRLCMH